ncbi:hypothetical protein ES702_06773 [subsurface metagenome]
MKISIKGNNVKIEDEADVYVCMSTDQLLEIMRVLNASMNQDGGFIFDLLEFTV